MEKFPYTSEKKSCKYALIWGKILKKPVRSDTWWSHDRTRLWNAANTNLLKEKVTIRIFGVCPISPTNGQEVWRGKTRLHQGMLRERMEGGWKKWGRCCWPGWRWEVKEVKYVFCLPMLHDSYYAWTMVWTLDVGTHWNVKACHAYKAWTQHFQPSSQAHRAWCWVTINFS